MKRIAIITAILLCASAPLREANAGQPIRGGSAQAPVYYVISAYTPGTMRRGGPNVWLCDGTADNVQIQAAIDKAQEASYRSEVRLSQGYYQIIAPIYIGYEAGVPQQNRGVSLIGTGQVDLTWGGTDQPDAGSFLLNISSLGGNNDRRYEHFTIDCNDELNGIYADTQAGARFNSILIQEPKYVGVVANDSWLSDWQGIEIWDGLGAGMALLGGNQARVSDLRIASSSSAANAAGFRGYSIVNPIGGVVANIFTPLEQLTNGNGEEATFLGYYTGYTNLPYIFVHHASGSADFAHDDTLTGAESGETADVNIAGVVEKRDLAGGLIVAGGYSAQLTNVSFEDVTYANESLSEDYPMIYITGRGHTLRNFTHEGHGSTVYATKGANTGIHADECEGMRISDVYWWTATLPSLGTTLSVEDDGPYVISAITPSEWEDRLAVGDTLYLWDAIGSGITEGEYTISAGGINDVANTITIDEDPGADSAVVYAYAVTAAIRYAPATLINLEECENTLIENVLANNFRTAIVNVDADCRQTTVINVQDWRSNEWNAENTWLLYARPDHILIDAGAVDTRVINPQIIDRTGLIYAGRTGVQEIREANGSVNQSTLMVHDQSVTINWEGDASIAHGTVKIFDFPEGRILVLGVVADLLINAVGEANISQTANGDFSLGTTGTADETLDTTDIDLGAKIAIGTLGTPSAGVGTADTELADSAQFDGTATAKDAYVSVIFDAGDVTTANGAVKLDGVVTITWIYLGDY